MDKAEDELGAGDQVGSIWHISVTSCRLLGWHELTPSYDLSLVSQRDLCVVMPLMRQKR